MPEKKSILTIKNHKPPFKAALDMGLNFFYTADVYGNGHNETLVGSVFRNIR